MNTWSIFPRFCLDFFFLPCCKWTAGPNASSFRNLNCGGCMEAAVSVVAPLTLAAFSDSSPSSSSSKPPWSSLDSKSPADLRSPPPPPARFFFRRAPPPPPPPPPPLRALFWTGGNVVDRRRGLKFTWTTGYATEKKEYNVSLQPHLNSYGSRIIPNLLVQKKSGMFFSVGSRCLVPIIDSGINWSSKSIHSSFFWHILSF